jgi:hypothetical protein
MAEEPFPTMTIAEAVAEARTQVARGEVVEFSDDFLVESAKRAEANARTGHKVRDEVKY